MAVNVFLPQVTRIPITGPDPYNTLVCVQAQGHGTGEYKLGKVFRGPCTVATPFILAGFDQRVPPVFEHSTTAFLSAIGLIENSNWLDAVDEITGAGFNPLTGQYYVNLNFALLETERVPQQCMVFSEYVGICFHKLTITVSSYVLCYEPPVTTKRGFSYHEKIIEPSTHSASLAQILSKKFDLGMVRSAVKKGGDNCDCKNKD